MTSSGSLAHEIGHSRRARPSRGPHAPHIAGGHPVDDPSASGTTSWPSWPTRSPCRPAGGQTRRAAAGHVWPAGGSGSAATQPPAVPAPQVGWWATPCSGRPSSWPRRIRGSGFHACGASEPSSPRRSECRSHEARCGAHAPHRPETVAVMYVPPALPAGARTQPHTCRSMGSFDSRGGAARAPARRAPNRATRARMRRGGRDRAAPRSARARFSHSPDHHAGRRWP